MLQMLDKWQRGTESQLSKLEEVDAYYQNMVKGGIIAGAVALDQWRQKRAAQEV